MPPSKPKVPAGEKDKNKKKKGGRKKVEDHVEHEEEVESGEEEDEVEALEAVDSSGRLVRVTSNREGFEGAG